MAWFILLIAGLCEIGWATGLKYSEGFTRLVPSVLTIVSMVVSIVLLGYALKTLPVGTGYAVWTGIGAVGTATMGILLLGESTVAMKGSPIFLRPNVTVVRPGRSKRSPLGWKPSDCHTPMPTAVRRSAETIA